MSTDTTDTTPSDTHDVVVDDHSKHDDGNGHREPTDKQYVIIALILAALTALEIASTELGWISGAPLVTVLISLMIVKFLFVAGFFMHLRFDNRLFTFVFYLGVFFAVGLYGVMLATFHFWTG